MRLLGRIDGQDIVQKDDLSISWVAGLSVDADGAPNCYSPDPRVGLDDLGNAGHAGNWWGVVTNDYGSPILQGPSDPFPNFYISTTSLQNKNYGRTDPRRYVNADVVPYIVVPVIIAREATGVVLGCVATVEDIRTNRKVSGVVADLGPNNHIGEASVAMARQLGVNPSPRTGGCSDPFFRYTFFPDQPAEGFQLQPL